MSTLLEIVGSAAGLFVAGMLFGSGDTFAGWVLERLRDRHADTAESTAVVILADGTRFPVGEIPRTRSGSVDPAWLDEHCKCGEPHVDPVASMETGGYL